MSFSCSTKSILVHDLCCPLCYYKLPIIVNGWKCPVSLYWWCRFIVPMKNGDLVSQGLLTSIIRNEGTIESFKVPIFFLFLTHNVTIKLPKLQHEGAVTKHHFGFWTNKHCNLSILWKSVQSIYLILFLAMSILHPGQHGFVCIII